MSQPPAGGEEPEARGRGNLFAPIAVIVLVGLGYWAFNYLDQQRKLQKTAWIRGDMTASNGSTFSAESPA